MSDALTSIAARITADFAGEPATFTVGDTRIHPDDGLIVITSGQYLSGGRVSNHWCWQVVATGAMHHGYGDEWPRAVAGIADDTAVANATSVLS